MRQCLLGQSGLRVSELCLGTLGFGEGKDWGTSAADAEKILGAFVDAGGTFVDTAPNYGGGAAEEIVGRFAAARRNQVVIGSKATASSDRHPLSGGNSRRTLIRSVEDSLTRLSTDYIDLLWLHFWDGTTPTDEILRAMDDLVSAGKVVYLSLSDTPAWVVSRAVTMAELRGWAPITAVQLEYNVVARTVERELLPMANALGLGVVCWGPYAAGALVGTAAGRRRRKGALSPELEAASAAVARIATESGTSEAAVALRWLQSGSSGQRLVPLVGARTHNQLQASLAALEAAVTIDLSAMVELYEVAKPSLGFPHELINSSYLKRFAFGDPSLFEPYEPRR